jgi:hypothetical protein
MRSQYRLKVKEHLKERDIIEHTTGAVVCDGGTCNTTLGG